MNRRILRLAIPNIISNITIPLLGLISMAIAGGIGSDVAIGAIGVGASIFGMIYWNCAFIRMGASGLTAQALGARNLRECANVLVRSMVVALTLAALLLVFQRPVGTFSMWLMGVQGEVRDYVAEYFYARVWAAPATISHYAMQGWFIGMQNSRFPMFIAISVNLLSIIFSYVLIYSYGMGIAGIGYGIMIAQYLGLGISIYLWLRYYGRFAKYLDWRESMQLKPMIRFFNVNKDIFLRTFFNVMVYTSVTMISARYGSDILATNTILVNLFTFFSYMLDGFGYAAEALVGRFTGARNATAMRSSVRRMFWWCFGVAVSFMAVYFLFWPQILTLFRASDAVMQLAGSYIGWIMIIPLVGFAPFLMDGILIGSTRTKPLRNSMMLSSLVFFAVYFIGAPHIGNDALWLAFVLFLLCRGILQLAMTDRLKIIYQFR